jgi:hypothetical protein
MGAVGLAPAALPTGALLSAAFIGAVTAALSDAFCCGAAVFDCWAIFDADELAMGVRGWSEDFVVSFFWVETAAGRWTPADFSGAVWAATLVLAATALLP